MQNRKIEIGERFSWALVGGGPVSEAVVTGLRSDHQEGLSPESEDYAALWIEARAIGSDPSPSHFTVMIGTDGKSYIEGQRSRN